jgi:hypothetical protein
MGMSGDFETAIMLGATHVRVGTALFGERVLGFAPRCAVRRARALIIRMGERRFRAALTAKDPAAA